MQIVLFILYPYYLRKHLFESSACFILFPRGWVLIQDIRPFSEHVLNLYPGNLSLTYSVLCWKPKKLDHSLFLRNLIEDPCLNFMNGRFGEQYLRVGMCDFIVARGHSLPLALCGHDYKRKHTLSIDVGVILFGFDSVMIREINS